MSLSVFKHKTLKYTSVTAMNDQKNDSKFGTALVTILSKLDKNLIRQKGQFTH